MIGTRLNHYEIVGKLGSGGMGEVYAAEDGKLNRRIAIKILPEDLAADPERRRRFEREAQAVAALNHPNIVTIYSVEESEGLHFITMELVEGKPLGELIPEGGFTLDEFFKISVPLVDALDAAHKKGITHRDLKPNNVMVSDEGRVKVLDFGLAKLANPESPLDPAEAATMVAGSDLTEQGQILGTVAYMSPEQAEGRPVDHRSDIFALGVVLYEMATGKAPFQGDTKISVITSIMRDTPLSVSDVNVDLPEHLGRVVNRSLAKSPDRRYQSTTDLRNELEDLKVEIDTSQLRESGVNVGVTPKRGERKVAYALVGAALFVGFVALAIMFGPRLGNAPTPTTVLTDGTPSLAVLYFDNLSGDEDLDWLRTGLTDMLITDLSQSPNLRVLGTDRVYQILSDMGRLDDATTSADLVDAVAQRGNVNNVLLGSFAMAGNTIRISARLQEAGSGAILGSETVEGVGEESIFSLVDDLTRRIKTRFSTTGQAVADVDTDLTDVTTDSVEAYRYYAEGVALHEQLKEREAIPLLEKAVEVDPGFAMAHAKLSTAYQNIGDAARSREFSTRAMENIDRVNDRERFYIEGRHFSLDDETVEESIAAYRKAIEAYPDHTSARNNLAQQLIELERFDEAIVHLEELRRRGMRFPGTFSSLATSYGLTGRLDEGLNVLRQYTEENPDNAAGFRNLAGHLTWSERYDEALDALRRAESLGLPEGQVAGIRWQIHALRDEWDRVEEIGDRLVETGNPLERAQGRFGQVSRALFEGDLDSAEDVFDVLIEEGDGPLLDQALNYAATVQLDVGDWAGALETSDRMLALAGDELGRRINGLVNRAGALAGRGDRDAAGAVADEVVEQVAGMSLPRRVVARREPPFRGAVAFYGGDWEGVVDALAPLLGRLPPREQLGQSERTRLHYMLATALYESGDLAGAEANFAAAIAQVGRVYDPIAYVRSLWFLGRIFEERGNGAAAQRYYARFLGYWENGELDDDRVDHAEEFLDARR